MYVREHILYVCRGHILLENTFYTVQYRCRGRSPRCHSPREHILLENTFYTVQYRCRGRSPRCHSCTPWRQQSAALCPLPAWESVCVLKKKKKKEPSAECGTMSESFACVRECVCVKKEKEKKEPSAECGTMSFACQCVCVWERKSVFIIINSLLVLLKACICTYICIYVVHMYTWHMQHWRAQRLLNEYQ
jgi:hypothetical protein